jgi:hypothetical protein
MTRSGPDYPNTIQQLMFNRILGFVRSLSCEHVTVTAFDPETGTLVGRLAGVNFLVNVSLEEPE